MGIEHLYQIYLEHPNVQTDTRKLEKGDIYFALKGERFDGNDYIPQALDKGASCCVTDAIHAVGNDKVLKVKDSLTALQQLAGFHREQLDIPVLAITGSNGKTTTKELIHAVLSTNLKCYTSAGNLNNHIGVPLTLLKIKNDAQIAVVEMGANHLHEIESYCKYAQPTHGLITNCGKAHLEGFGSEENIRKGKGELFDYIKKTNGELFINTDLPYLISMAGKAVRQITYGNDAANVQGNIIHKEDGYLSFTTTYRAERFDAHTQLVGDYNFPNALAAVCVGYKFGINSQAIKAALEAYMPSNSRSQMLLYKNNHVILDAYNANPSSMSLAIENFAGKNVQNKIVYLGAMKELGSYSDNEHQQIIKQLQQHSWQEVVLVGEEFKNVPKPFVHYNFIEDAVAHFKNKQYSNANLLIKGSRGLAMEKLLQH